MGFPAVAVGALGFAQYQQQGAIGKYNQSIQNRNAQIAEQEAAQLEKQLEFDIGKFNQQFEKLEGTQIVNTAKSGVDFSGTATRIARANAEEAELQRQVMAYNTKIGQAQKFEEANFSRIQGSLARQQAKLAQIKTVSDTGTSLLKMGGYI
jgi:chromosome segregation ATPase